MQSRVHQFNALAPVSETGMVNVPACKESFCRWLVHDSANFASAIVERPLRRLRGRAPPGMPGYAAAAPETEREDAADE